MKIRNGFVSNSSSSSFVVAFPHDPVSADDICSMIFDLTDDKWIEDGFGYSYRNTQRCKWIAEQVWKYVTEQKTKPDVRAELEGSVFTSERVLESALGILLEMLGPEPDKADLMWPVWNFRKDELTFRPAAGTLAELLAGPWPKNASPEQTQHYLNITGAVHRGYAERQKQEILKQINGSPYYIFNYDDSYCADTVVQYGMFDKLQHWCFSAH